MRDNSIDVLVVIKPQEFHGYFQGLKTAIIEGDVMGGTCVNRGCVPSKALLAVSGRMRELQDEHHLKALGLQVFPLLFRIKMKITNSIVSFRSCVAFFIRYLSISL